MYCQTPPGCFFLSLLLHISLEVKQIITSHNVCSSLLKRILEVIDQCYWINTMSLSHLNFLDNKITGPNNQDTFYRDMRRGHSYERSRQQWSVTLGWCSNHTVIVSDCYVCIKEGPRSLPQQKWPSRILENHRETSVKEQ